MENGCIAYDKNKHDDISHDIHTKDSDELYNWKVYVYKSVSRCDQMTQMRNIQYIGANIGLVVPSNNDIN